MNGNILIQHIIYSLNNKDSKMEIVEEQVNLDEVKRQVTEWNTERQEKDNVKSIFDQAGNTFSVTFSEPIESDELHFYISWDKKDDNLVFYVVPSNEDTGEQHDERYIQKCIVSSTKEKLPMNVRDSHNEGRENIARERINNWIEQDSRDSWIEERFNGTGPSEAIFQVFVIRTSDFAVGAEHKCYLALKILETGRYQADVMVVNTISQEVFKPSSTLAAADDIEDLALPKPPYGGDYSQFGLLQ